MNIALLRAWVAIEGSHYCALGQRKLNCPQHSAVLSKVLAPYVEEYFKCILLKKRFCNVFFY